MASVGALRLLGCGDHGTLSLLTGLYAAASFDRHTMANKCQELAKLVMDLINKCGRLRANKVREVWWIPLYHGDGCRATWEVPSIFSLLRTTCNELPGLASA